MQQVEPADHLSNLELDEWFAGELEPGTRARFDQHLSQCASCQARRAQFEREAAQFFAEAPSFRATPRRLRSRTAGWALATLAALAASIALVVWPKTEEHARVKGTAHMDFFVKRGQVVRRGQAGEDVYPGDLLRFVYTADRPSYLAVFNVDSRVTTSYFPNADQAARVAAGTDMALDFSVELDAQLGPERVVAFFCREPFALEPVRAALAAAAPPPAAVADCERDQIELHKKAHP